MNIPRIAAWLFGAAVVGAWFASAASVSRVGRTPRVPPRSQTSTVENLAADVQAQAARLRAKLESAPAPKTPFRNPFTFSDRPAQRIVPVRPDPAPVVTPAPVVPAEPPIHLIGVAEKKVEQDIVRTAMLTVGDADNLIMATVGQKILGAYEVVAISSDVVELKDLTTGATRRLVLQ